MPVNENIDDECNVSERLLTRLHLAYITNAPTDTPPPRSTFIRWENISGANEAPRVNFGNFQLRPQDGHPMGERP
jgi:hypothetical protein